MKKHYNSPQTTVEPFEPLLLDVEPGSEGGGEYQGGMDVDAPYRNEFDEELTQQQNSDAWKAGLW